NYESMRALACGGIVVYSGGMSAAANKKEANLAMDDVDMAAFLETTGTLAANDCADAEEVEEIEEIEEVATDRLVQSLDDVLFDDLETSTTAVEVESQQANESLKLRIATYYINKQLENMLLDFGDIPESSSESALGVGFIDIADYSYLSNWLSPRENHVFLNGLYSAFHHVLRRNGGYLNKISGDSMMFHFGGVLDPLTRHLTVAAAEAQIARQLFLTCIEIQASCRLFNRADEDFIPVDADPSDRRCIQQAYMIIRNLRENLSLITSIDALFQVRIRIGAAIGDVCIGNFGPSGARQWDVIGVPVIEARRMESSAPLDGIRISRRLFEVLDASGLVAEYHASFRSKASGFYQGITRDELFKLRDVTLFEKKGAVFNSCAVQANPDLPEDIWRQIESRIELGESGVPALMTIIQYYRGNRLVIGALEELFRERGLRLHKERMIRLLSPSWHKELQALFPDETALRAHVDSTVSLVKLFRLLGAMQDHLKKTDCPSDPTFPASYTEEWLGQVIALQDSHYRKDKKYHERMRYFQAVLLPAVFACLEAGIREYIVLHQAELGKASYDKL
ncbi:MAG TPA: hypothetical protein DCQ73_11460, partial [Spirochaetaceae bacterium]|nr:hypothetical protein [Spirochaetaceae bacterium]HAX37791.1 hypothetical protein [Spirochaetaceae bacterium]HCQ88286.1 hypothetical protein [Spirochaetaceae bacterium]